MGDSLMGEKKKSVIEDVEDTMACSAFAEAGEPCPIDMACSAFAEAGEPCPIDEDKKEGAEKKDTGMSVQDTMACSAFAEAGEPCPIDEDKKEE
jgi:hypothetical protein